MNGIPVAAGHGKHKKGKGPATRRQRTALRRRIEREGQPVVPRRPKEDDED